MLLLTNETSEKKTRTKEVSSTKYTDLDIHTIIYLPLLYRALQKRKDVLTMQSSPFSFPLLFFLFLFLHSTGQLKEWQKKRNECDREKFDFRCDKLETVQPMCVYMLKRKETRLSSIEAMNLRENRWIEREENQLLQQSSYVKKKSLKYLYSISYSKRVHVWQLLTLRLWVASHLFDEKHKHAIRRRMKSVDRQIADLLLIPEMMNEWERERKKVLNTRIWCPEGTLQTILDTTVKIEQKIYRCILLVDLSMMMIAREGDRMKIFTM